ncbi:hypothetical protein SGCZBJ_14695 [Caulobacter zeae]|uniref:Uncharacterized protein n=1 Tax=Caulobacter zeae TaxID=2055137 RepID=A0A2N5DD00_9CAUL|nr:hypothetical protein SGCZBJ_14695 [Caulobacter zeae]
MARRAGGGLRGQTRGLALTRKTTEGMERARGVRTASGAVFECTVSTKPGRPARSFDLRPGRAGLFRPSPPSASAFPVTGL